MAHFAELDADNVVVRVLVVPDEQEHRGQEFLADDCALGGRWVQTSYNGNIRRRFAGIGMRYDESADIFIGIQPFPSWTLDSDLEWQAPVAKPDGPHIWSEEQQQWVPIPTEQA